MDWTMGQWIAAAGVSRTRQIGRTLLMLGLFLWPVAAVSAHSYPATALRGHSSPTTGWFDGWFPGGRGGGGGRDNANRPGSRSGGPVIERLVPPPGQATRNAEGPITFEVTGPLPFGLMRGFIVRESLALSVDGTDRTAETRFEPGGLAAYIPWIPAMSGTIQFAPAQPLGDGERTIVVRIANSSGRTGELQSALQVDTRAPRATAANPDEGARITDLARPLIIAIADEGVGIDWASVQVDLDGRSARVVTDSEAGRVTVSPEGEWAEGELRVNVSAADSLGNGGTRTLVYEVSPEVALAASVRANPASGDAPLTVSLEPDVTTNTAIELYRWDFDGDGVNERSDPIGRTQQYTYQQSGTHEPRLTVVDSRGKEATATATIEVGNAPPEVTASAGPSNGAPPLAVDFTATASDRDGIEFFEWDFDGDGVHDRTTAAGATSFTYESEGTFQPRIRVTDTAGAATEVAVPGIEVRVNEGAPTVTAQASPASGEVPLDVSFDGSASDPDGEAMTEWAWDFDRDGTFDYTSPDSAGTTFEYIRPGTYYPRLRVTAADGGSSSDVVRVEVRPSVNLSVSTDTIDTQLGESVNVQTELGGDTRVSLVVEDVAGRIVRTIVPWQRRAAGEYSDSWDGMADDGAAVSEGEYRIVLLYEVDGVERRLDLSTTTGGNEYNPSRSRLPNSFSPFAGDPLVIDFTLREASRVTAFMGRYNVNTRLVTFHQRKPLGRGAHTIVWNGANAEGELIHPPPGDSFLFGIFAFTLPDNAVYVRSGVHVTNLTSTPAVLVPGSATPDGRSAAVRLEFDLSRAGAVELTVFDAENGGFVDRRRIEGLQAGPNTIEWDGRTEEGEFVAPGRYRVGISGVDGRGSQTPAVYTLQRVYY